MKLIKANYKAEEVEIYLNENKLSPIIDHKKNKSPQFREVITYLIKNNIIKNNIIDLRSWNGVYSFGWALLKPNDKIYCLDSSDKNLNFIEEIAQLNKINNIRTINTISNLDYLLKIKVLEHIGYIHLDLEDLNFDTIQGATNIINLYNPIITFEYDSYNYDYGNLISHLKCKNYLVYKINELFVDSESSKNFICLPKYDNINIKIIKDYVENEYLFSIM